jgi:ATP-dependent protease HslVU (ClpYQ) peptidase subunit
MTVIAWDSVTLAADRQANASGAIYQVTKIFRVGDTLVGLSGDFSHALMMLDWLRTNGNVANFPAPIGEDKGFLLVIHRDGRIQRYEYSPFPLLVEEKRHANGSGREFALAAMHCGRTAVEAVEVACALSCDCGLGIDTLTFEDVST